MIHQSKLFVIPENRNGIERIGFFVGIAGKFWNIFVTDTGKGSRDVHRGIHFADMGDKSICGCGIVLGSRDFGNPGKMCQFFVGGTSVCFENDRKQDGISQSMRNPVLPTQAVCYRVYIADITFGKCSTGEIRGAEHLLSCDTILPVFISSREIPEDQLNRFDSSTSGLFCGGTANVCFDRMGQGIHPGGRSKLWRQTNGNFRFQNSIMGDQTEIVDCVFVMGIGIGDDSGKCCFTSGSCSGGNCNQQREFVHDMKDSLHLSQCFIRTGQSGTDTFGAVHGRATAESKKCLAVFFKIQVFCLFYVSRGRIGYCILVDVAGDSCFFQKLFQRCSQSKGIDPRIGNEKKPGNVVFAQNFRNTGKSIDQLRFPVRHQRQGSAKTDLKTTTVKFF